MRGISRRNSVPQRKRAVGRKKAGSSSGLSRFMQHCSYATKIVASNKDFGTFEPEKFCDDHLAASAIPKKTKI